MATRRKSNTAPLLLIVAAFVLLPSIAPAQGALYRYFKAKYGILITRDSTLGFAADPAVIKQIGDSLGYGGKDTITIGAARWSTAGDDSAYTTFFDYAGWDARYGSIHSATTLANATGDWKLIRIAIRHSYVVAGVEYMRDTVAEATTNQYVVPAGGQVYIAYSPASSYGTTQDFKSFDDMQMIGVWAANPNESVRTTYTRMMQQVHLPLVLVPGTGQVGLGDDHHITVTATFIRL